jgi:hypothetical protein
VRNWQFDCYRDAVALPLDARRDGTASCNQGWKRNCTYDLAKLLDKVLSNAWFDYRSATGSSGDGSCTYCRRRVVGLHGLDTLLWPTVGYNISDGLDGFRMCRNHRVDDVVAGRLHFDGIRAATWMAQEPGWPFHEFVRDDS